MLSEAVLSYYYCAVNVYWVLRNKAIVHETPTQYKHREWFLASRITVGKKLQINKTQQTTSSRQHK